MGGGWGIGGGVCGAGDGGRVWGMEVGVLGGVVMIMQKRYATMNIEFMYCFPNCHLVASIKKDNVKKGGLFHAYTRY